MAIRIRKLAREVGRPAEHLLGVLHALGFTRFRSPEDMLNDNVARKLRKGLAEGLRPLSVEVKGAKRAAPSTGLEAVASSTGDVMANLVPGVVPTGGQPAAQAASPRRRPHAQPTSGAARGAGVGRPPAVPPGADSPARPVPSPPIQTVDEDVEVAQRANSAERAALESLRRTLNSQQAVLDAERHALEDGQARLAARERSLERERAALDELQRNLELERSALAAERRLGATRGGSKAGASLESMLDARGLRGSDEYQRAIEALAKGRHLHDLLWTLSVSEPEAIGRLLDDRLLLVGGPVPDALTRGVACVTVASERADVPGGDALATAVERASDALLLQGVRRVLLVGGAARAARFLRGAMDARIEVDARPATAARDEQGALDDVSGADAVVLWGVEALPEAQAVYDAARPLVVAVPDRTLSSLFAAIIGHTPT